MPTPRSASPLAIWSALGAVYVIWGSTYLAIAIAVQTLPPLFSAGLRFCLAGLVLLGFIAVRRGLRVGREQLIGAAIVGLLLIVGGNGFVVLAERTVPSGLTALIIASVPLWIVIFRRIAGDRIHVSTFIGVAVGFAGVAFLVVPRGSSGEVDGGGLLLLFVATISWALGTFLSPRLRMPRDALLSTGIQQLAGGIVLVASGTAMGELAHLEPATWSTRSLLAMAYLVVFGSLVAFTAYSWLLQHASVSLVSTYAYVNPVVAVFLGALVLAEPITPSIVIGAAIIIAAVAFIVTREGARQRAASATDEPRAAASEAD
ncbi:MAG TPA: EamA family transporter [Chloroflexi bacterium]|jgi:drug/metabolite transporter (DMT)-like permease|nr:EamA family transporter [Chloroflexota bacterium]